MGLPRPQTSLGRQAPQRADRAPSLLVPEGAFVVLAPRRLASPACPTSVPGPRRAPAVWASSRRFSVSSPPHHPRDGARLHSHLALLRRPTCGGRAQKEGQTRGEVPDFPPCPSPPRAPPDFPFSPQQQPPQLPTTPTSRASVCLRLAVSSLWNLLCGVSPSACPHMVSGLELALRRCLSNG